MFTLIFELGCTYVSHCENGNHHMVSAKDGEMLTKTATVTEEEHEYIHTYIHTCIRMYVCMYVCQPRKETRIHSGGNMETSTTTLSEQLVS